MSDEPFIDGPASIGGLVLLGASALALMIANSPLAASYADALHLEVAGLSLVHWVNDALMALFFLLIGLEVKRELVSGELSSWDRRLVPGTAAVAGMAVPAAIFLLVNASSPHNRHGWAIPAATDIAFALGILALLGPRVPASLKVLLTAIAVLDDLLAIVVIALFYTEQLAPLPLLAALAGLGFLVLLNRAGVRRVWPFLLVGLGIWYAVLLSGVHATLAGVAVGLVIPEGASLERLAHRLQPWVAFFVLPIFAFANAGVSFGGLAPGSLAAPLSVGVALGLLLGKQIGILGAIWLLVRFGLADLPARASWRQVWGMAVLCGIGFTMSLFIGGLAFGDAGAEMDRVKLGVLGGSIVAGLVGALILRGARPVGDGRPVPAGARQGAGPDSGR